MAETENLTVTFAAEMADVIRSAVDTGDYSSPDEVVHAALRDWESKRARRGAEFEALKADIDTGLADVAAGRMKNFDTERIVARGRQRLAARSSSA